MKIYNIQKTDGDSYALINDETKKEGGLFTTKSEGTSLIIDMAKEKHISAVHTLDLFRKIHDLDIPCWPGVSQGSFEEIIYQDCRHTIESMLEEKAYMEQYDGKPTLIMCYNCGKHGKIWSQDFEANRIVAKDQAYKTLKVLYADARISVSEKRSLKKQIAESNLPEECPAGEGLMIGILVGPFDAFVS
jgi:hypothetical protein